MPISDAWIDQVYRCSTGEVPWAESLRPLLVETKTFCMGAVNHTIMPIAAKVFINVDGPENLAEAYEHTFVSENPVFDTLSGMSPGTCMTGFSNQGVGNQQVSKFFSDYLIPNNVGDALWVSLARRPGDFFMLAFPRMPDVGAFTQTDLDNFQPFVLHLVRAFDVWLKLNLSKAENNWVTAAMDQVPNGMITLGPHRTIFYANRAAESFLTSMKGAQRQMLKLRFADAAVDLQFQSILDALPDTTGPHGDNILILRRGATQAPILLRVEPTPKRSDDDIVPSPVAVLHIIDPDARALNGIAAFARSYKLSAAETKLLERLVRNGSIVEAAGEVGVAESTARTQVKSIYAKTGEKTLGMLLMKVFRSTLA